MNILYIAPWIPWPPFDGARIRIAETLRFLAQRHRIWLLTPFGDMGETHQSTPIQTWCERVETYGLPTGHIAMLRRVIRGLSGQSMMEALHWHAELAKRLRVLTATNAFDVLHIEFSYLGRYVQVVHPASTIQTVLSLHNVETIRFDRELALPSTAWNERRLVLWWDRHICPQWERNAVRSFHGLIATSEPEQEWLRQRAPQAVVARVPNGVDTTYFYEIVPAVKRLSLVFTGLMNYPPNIDAVLWFGREIWPQLRLLQMALTFRIVGRCPDKRVLALGHQADIEVTGEVPDFAHIAEALALVVPLRAGGGTRLKILQSMAMGRPVISTRLGAEGLDITPGENILLAENADAFCQHVKNLLQAPAWADQLGQAGRQLVLQQYDWPLCFRGMEDLYDTLATG